MWIIFFVIRSIFYNIVNCLMPHCYQSLRWNRRRDGNRLALNLWITKRKEVKSSWIWYCYSSNVILCSHIAHCLADRLDLVRHIQMYYKQSPISMRIIFRSFHGIIKRNYFDFFFISLRSWKKIKKWTNDTQTPLHLETYLYRVARKLKIKWKWFCWCWAELCGQDMLRFR